MFGYATIGAAGNILASAAATHAANKAGRRAAREQREWAERMAQSAHQFEVQDLRAAGLNPILSAGGSGASVPGGSSAAQVHKVDTSGIGQIFSDVAALSQIEVAQSQRDLNAAQAAKVKSETDFNTQSLQDRLNIEKERLNELNSIINLNRNKQYLTADQAAKVRKEWDIVKENVKLLQGKVHEQTIRNNLLEKENSWFNVTNTAKVSKDFAQALDSASSILPYRQAKKLMDSVLTTTRGRNWTRTTRRNIYK